MQSSRQQTTSYKNKVAATLEAAPDKRHMRPWEQWEIDILKKYYLRKSTALIAKLLNRTERSVRIKGAEAQHADL